jgi:PadR family transcriptional regulator, regulatory protein PadR
MKGTQLGEFEEVVLLSIAMLYDDAYSVAVLEALNARMGRPLSLGMVHRTMQRLEEKNLLSSRFGQASAERGGRRKRLFTVTMAGENALREARRVRDALWDGISETAFGH